MTLDILRLTLETQGISYDITMIEEVRQTQSKDAFSISPPGMGPEDNILLGMNGMQGGFEIRFQLHNDGTDKANGSHSSSVVTLSEQRRYLQEEIHHPAMSVRWTLDHIQGDETMIVDTPVTVENVDITPITNSSRKWLPARISLIVGDSIG